LGCEVTPPSQAPSASDLDGEGRAKVVIEQRWQDHVKQNPRAVVEVRRTWTTAAAHGTTDMLNGLPDMVSRVLSRCPSRFVNAAGSHGAGLWGGERYFRAI
jgi:hypothetical protein